MKSIKIIFISISGNTKNFSNNITSYAKSLHAKNSEAPLINSIEISDQTELKKETYPYFVLVPTYLTGNDQNAKEIMTNSLNEYINYDQNAKYCIGIIGNGNKNFDKNYCLTAKYYSKQFNAPLIGNFELRGNKKDIVNIYNNLIKQIKKIIIN